MASSAKDLYVNRALTTLTMSAANTLTFQQIRFAAGLFEGMAIVIHRILWTPSGTSWRELGANTDLFSLALTTRDDLTDINPTNLSVLCSKIMTGVGAQVEPKESPLVSDFTTLPGGGLLAPANPIYAAATTSGAAAASLFYIIIEYTWKKLTPQESIELLQTLIPGTV